MNMNRVLGGNGRASLFPVVAAEHRPGSPRCPGPRRPHLLGTASQRDGCFLTTTRIASSAGHAHVTD